MSLIIPVILERLISLKCSSITIGQWMFLIFKDLYSNLHLIIIIIYLFLWKNSGPQWTGLCGGPNMDLTPFQNDQFNYV